MYQKNIFQKDSKVKTIKVVRPAMKVDSFGNVYLINEEKRGKSSRNVKKTSVLVSKYRR